MSAEDSFSDAELLGYLDELLPAERATVVEAALRNSSELQQRAAALLRERDEGVHSLADIWRRHRIGCPDPASFGNYLLGVLDEPVCIAIDRHVDDVGCRFCRAELDDLIAARTDVTKQERTQRFFESSVGTGRRQSIDQES